MRSEPEAVATGSIVALRPCLSSLGLLPRADGRVTSQGFASHPVAIPMSRDTEIDPEAYHFLLNFTETGERIEGRIDSSLGILASDVHAGGVRTEAALHGPKRWRYSIEVMNALTISALM
jgi:hypothetical protein